VGASNSNQKIYIGATFYGTVVTWHHHFWKWWWLSPPLFQRRISNFASNSKFMLVFFLLPEAFCGLKHAENAIAARAPPRTPLHWGSLRRFPRLPGRLGRGHPSSLPIPDPTRRFWRVDARAFGASIVVPPWHQILATPLVNWSAPLFKVKVATTKIWFERNNCSRN